jgi:uncharacterized protein (TIGR00369 family)
MDDAAIFERIRASVARQSAMTTIGARLVEARRGTVTIELGHGEHILQQNSFVHGGVLGMIADSACGYAALTMLEANKTVLTTEYKIHFLSPALGEKFIAVGRVIKPGRQLSVVQGDVYAVTGETKKHIAIMLTTLMAVEKRDGLVD